MKKDRRVKKWEEKKIEDRRYDDVWKRKEINAERTGKVKERRKG